MAVGYRLVVTPINSLTGPRFLIALTTWQMDEISTAKSTKSKDDSVWCQKLHGLKHHEVLKPAPLFSSKLFPTGSNYISTTGIKGVWSKHPPQRRKRLAVASNLATLNLLITNIFLPFLLSYSHRKIIWTPKTDISNMHHSYALPSFIRCLEFKASHATMWLSYPMPLPRLLCCNQLTSSYLSHIL